MAPTKDVPSLFADLKVGNTIEVFELVKRFTEDTFASKVNLSVGGKHQQTNKKTLVRNCAIILLVRGHERKVTHTVRNSPTKFVLMLCGILLCNPLRWKPARE